MSESIKSNKMELQHVNGHRILQQVDSEQYSHDYIDPLHYTLVEGKYFYSLVIVIFLCYTIILCGYFCRKFLKHR